MLPSLPGITLKQSGLTSVVHTNMNTTMHRGQTLPLQLDYESDSTRTRDVEEFNPFVEEPVPLRMTPNNTSSISEDSSTVSLSPSPSTSAASADPPRTKTRLRAIVEHVVYHPMVTWFTCGTNRSSSTRASGSLHQSILQTKAPRAIIQTMKQFPYQGRLQKLGCATLRDLALDSWPLKVSVVEAGAIPVLLKAMRLHPSDAALNGIACRALYELVNVPPHCDDRSVVIAVLQTIEHHVNDEDVLVVALEVLLALTDNSPAAIESLRHQLGGVALAKLEHAFQGRNESIYTKAGILLKRLYF